MFGVRERGITSPASVRNAIAAKDKYGGYAAAAEALSNPPTRRSKPGAVANFVAGCRHARMLMAAGQSFSVSAYDTVHNIHGVRYSPPYKSRKGINHQPSVRYKINVKPKRKS